MGENPTHYHSASKVEVMIPLRVGAKLATYRREMHPEKTDAEVIAYLVEDSLVRLGVLELPAGNRAKGAGKR